MDEYCHFHHSNTRKVAGVMWLVVKQVFNMKADDDAANLAKRKDVLDPIMAKLEMWLGGKTYLAATKAPTIADIMCYCELDEIDTCKLFDYFNMYPNVTAWMDRMKALPKHDDVRVSLRDFYKKAQDGGIIP